MPQPLVDALALGRQLTLLGLERESLQDVDAPHKSLGEGRGLDTKELD
jgi:hypothetical protein